MNSLIRKAGLFTLGALLLASMAVAGIPNGSTSDFGPTPGAMSFVGASSAAGSPAGTEGIDVTDPAGLETWTIRDGNSVAVPNVLVVIDFSGCPGLHFCTVQNHPGMTLNCTLRTITATTNGLGQVSFNVVGYAENPGGGLGPGPSAPCANVTSLGQPLKSLVMSAYDQGPGTGGVNPADGSLVDADRFAWIQTACVGPGPLPAGCVYHTRSDFNGDGSQNPADRSLWSALRVATIQTGTSAFSCSALSCP
jgi:hypothetical protein